MLTNVLAFLFLRHVKLIHTRFLECSSDIRLHSFILIVAYFLLLSLLSGLDFLINTCYMCLFTPCMLWAPTHPIYDIRCSQIEFLIVVSFLYVKGPLWLSVNTTVYYGKALLSPCPTPQTGRPSLIHPQTLVLPSHATHLTWTQN